MAKHKVYISEVKFEESSYVREGLIGGWPVLFITKLG